MSEQIDSTFTSVEDDINLNFRRLQESREKGDSKPLQDLFEQRMNSALETYGEMMVLLGHVSIENA